VYISPKSYPAKRVTRVCIISAFTDP